LIWSLIFGGLGHGRLRNLHPAPAKEKRKMPGAALAATKWPQEQQIQDGPLQEAATVRPQNVFTPAKRAFTETNPE
jgi:hypothetical protein